LPIKLTNGLIVDGTGSKAYMGNLIVDEGKIIEITSDDQPFSGETIDCSAKVIAPGFIDSHSHMEWVLPASGNHHLKTPFTAQGITTFITGNCGYGIAGFRKESEHRDLLEIKTFGLYPMDWDTMDEYNAYLKTHGISHNMANFAGHGTTRASICGHRSGPLSPDEMKEMLRLLENALDQGALGVSFGLGYEPGIFAPFDELLQIARLVKKKNKMITVHLKAYSSLSGTYPLKLLGKPHNIIAIEEMLELARQTGVKLQISHLIFVGARTWKTFDRAIKLIDDAIAEGLDVMFDSYAYHCGNSIISVFMPEWFLSGGQAAYKNKAQVRRLRLEIALMIKLLGFGYEHIQITNAKHKDFDRYNGMYLDKIADGMNTDPFTAMMRISEATEGQARVLNYGYSNLEQIKSMMQHPACLFECDCEVAHSGVQNPTAYGNYPRFLQYARDFKILSLEEVVHKMTGMAADRFSLTNRGVLKEGYAADITVFDWQNIRDNNTREKTSEPPSGIEHVFINGEEVLSKGIFNTELLPGQVLMGETNE
jgi:N-acyl-D-aspartate/D-glutamate deacylase